MSVDDQFIERQRMLKTARRARGQAFQVHRDRTVHGQAQDVLAVPPVFDES